MFVGRCRLGIVTDGLDYARILKYSPLAFGTDVGIDVDVATVPEESVNLEY